MPVEPNPTLPEGFPDLFVFALKDRLIAEIGNDVDFPGELFLTRPARPNDPSSTISVFEEDSEPAEYEMAGRGEQATITTYNVVIQVMVKHSNEIEGRNVRKRLLSRCRKALFSATTRQVLMTLSDDDEHVSKYRLRRTDYANAEAVGAGTSQGQFFFLGMMTIMFQTELR